MSELAALANFKLPSTTISLPSLLYQNGIVLLTCFGLLAAFCLLRPNNGAVYHRRRKLSHSNRAFPKLPSGPFSWFRVVWRTSEEEILLKCGLDAVMFLRLVRLGLVYALGTVPFGLALVGVDYFAKEAEVASETSGFDLQRLTITNVDAKSFLWVHIAFGWISFFFLGAWLYKNNHDISSRTLVLYHLPERCQSPDGLKEFLAELPPRFQSYHLSLAPNVAHLPQLVQALNFHVRELEGAASDFVDGGGHQIGPRPTHRVDSIEYHSNRILELFYEFQEARDYIAKLPPMPVGFVTFENAFIAHVVLQALLPGEGFPPVERHYLGEPWHVKAGNQVAFDTFPLAFLGAVANVAGMRKLFNDDTLFSGPISKPLIEGTLSPLIMIFSMSLVQLVLRKLSIAQSAITHSLVDRRLLAKYYTFLLFNHLIVFSALQTFPTAIQAFRGFQYRGAGGFVFGIKQMIPQLGTPFTRAIVQTSSFWVNQMALRTIGYFFELIQVVTLARRFFKKHFLRLSARDLSEAAQPQAFDYPVAYALQCFNFTILLLFGITSPLIIPFSLFNFLVSFFVYKHQTMFVYQTRIESGGRLWITAFNRLIVAIILSQFFLLLVFLLSGADDVQWRVVLPLPFLTVVSALTHQTWVLSKFELIDWRVKSPPIHPHLPRDANLRREFHRLVFHQELVSPQLSGAVLSAVPELSRVQELLNDAVVSQSVIEAPTGYEPLALSTSQGDAVDDATFNETSSESGSLIELLDRNQRYRD
ncbi:hypothetical protein L0F63_007041 [Massospora cicadina]|nr:hypothetical protein L0F63_007041 [Massospora cicadina]